MKGQISFEFYFALFIFVGFVTYIAFQVIVSSPNYLRQLQSQTLTVNVYRVSELLVDDNGYPVNWQTNPSSLQRLGLSDETQNVTNMISMAKITALGTLCSSNYNGVKQLLDIDASTQMILSISDIATNTNLVTCTPQQIISKNTATVTMTRIVALNDGTYANVTVTMW